MEMLRMYRMYDRVSEVCQGPIVLERTDGAAVRTFYAVLSDKSTGPGQFPGDWELLFLGTCEAAGVITAPDRPLLVTTGAVWMALQNLEIVKPTEAARDA